MSLAMEMRGEEVAEVSGAAGDYDAEDWGMVHKLPIEHVQIMKGMRANVKAFGVHLGERFVWREP